MVTTYYDMRGWDHDGRPLPETLKRVGLEDALKELWP